MALLKKILFRPSIRHPRLQRFWGRLHTLSLYGMNLGGGGLIESSGELWTLSHVVAAALAEVDSPVAFDVGAHVGDYAVQLAHHLPSARIYAFEPGRTAYERLAQRVAEAASGRIRAFNLGFSDAAREAELWSYLHEGQPAPFLSSIDRRLPAPSMGLQPHASQRIEVQTVDGFCETSGIDGVDFLKLDVEGHELSVLRGARRMLAGGSIRAIQFELGPPNMSSRTYFWDFWSLLSDDYDIFRIIPRGIVPIRFYGEHLEVFLTTNYLALRKRRS